MIQKKAVKAITNIKQVIMFEFNCSENLIFFAERFYKTERKKRIQNDLFVYKNKYRLLFYCRKKYVENLIKYSELADRISFLSTDIAVTHEHARRISKNNAAEKLGKAFLKEP